MNSVSEPTSNCITPDPVLGTSAQIQGILLFTGHMIDAPERKLPRFPASKTAVAKAAIADTVRDHCVPGREHMLGIASGASGGDILFHEVCAELGIDTRVFLALPAAQFVEHSVAPAGPDWVRRFYATVHSKPTYVLDAALAASTGGCNMWQQTNLWMLREAVRFGSEKVLLIALWDGEQGDGPGGTGDLIARSTREGVTAIALDTKDLFDLESQSTIRSAR